VAANGSSSPWYPGFKAAVFALLAYNTAYYLFGRAWTQALDALAWLTLLALFALETGFDGAVGALKPRPCMIPNIEALCRHVSTMSRSLGKPSRPEDRRSRLILSVDWLPALFAHTVEYPRPRACIHKEGRRMCRVGEPVIILLQPNR